MPTGTIGEELRALRAQTGGRMPVSNSGAAAPAPAQANPQGKPRSTVKDFGTGIVKGMGDTAINLGEMVHSIPGIGDLTDKLSTMIGPEGTNPETAFTGARGYTKPESGAESAGKTVEQIAEFFTPVKGTGIAKIETLPIAMRKGLIAKLASMIPNNASPEMMKLLNKAGTYTGRVAGDAGTSAAVSLAHGADEGEAERSGLIAGLGPAVLGPVAGAAGKAGTKFAGSPMGRQILPYMAALGTSAAGNFSSGGLGAGLGAFGLTRMMARRLLDAQHITPTVARNAGRAAQSGAETGMRLTAAGTDTTIPRRRLAQ